ncbi:hypothetical protein [Ferrovibrio sp.]|uniref:hypothetical protein n=1 Tax=Ferrovibrio sp. TaxID=1917215 RepID=UPI003D2BDF15
MNPFSSQRSKRLRAALGYDGAEAEAVPAEPEVVEEPTPPEPPPPLPSAESLSAQLELLSQRFEAARREALAGVLILGDAQNTVQGLREACQRLGQRHAAEALGLLGASLRRAEPLNRMHFDVMQLQLEAARALFRLNAAEALVLADELLNGLRRAAWQHFDGDERDDDGAAKA